MNGAAPGLVAWQAIVGLGGASSHTVARSTRAQQIVICRVTANV